MGAERGPGPAGDSCGKAQRQAGADTWGQLGGSGSREAVAGGVGLPFPLFSALPHPQHLLKTQPSLREGLWGCAAGLWVCEGV